MKLFDSGGTEHKEIYVPDDDDEDYYDEDDEPIPSEPELNTICNCCGCSFVEEKEPLIPGEETIPLGLQVVGGKFGKEGVVALRHGKELTTTHVQTKNGVITVLNIAPK